MLCHRKTLTSALSSRHGQLVQIKFCLFRVVLPADRVLGWRTPTWSGGFVRWINIGLATFLVDCLAIRETELVLNTKFALDVHGLQFSLDFLTAAIMFDDQFEGTVSAQVIFC